MNKRIKELAIEARLLTGWPVGEVEYQKFAELIVRESDLALTITAQSLANQALKHFTKN